MLITAELCRYMEGQYFEEFVGEIYTFLGYNVSSTPTTGDQGLDLILVNSKETIGVQCKRFKGSIGNSAVQEVFAGKHFYKCDKAIVITSSRFTASAKKLAQTLEVELIGIEELNNILYSIQDSLLTNFHSSYKLTEILINSSLDLIFESDRESDTVAAVKLLEHLLANKNKLPDSQKILLINNLCLGLKRIDNLDKAIELYKNSLGYLSFEDEDGRYLMVANLLVCYIQKSNFKSAKELLNTVNEQELTGMNIEHFENTKIRIEANGDI